MPTYTDTTKCLTELPDPRRVNGNGLEHTLVDIFHSICAIQLQGDSISQHDFLSPVLSPFITLLPEHTPTVNFDHQEIDGIVSFHLRSEEWDNFLFLLSEASRVDFHLHVPKGASILCLSLGS